jgi:hypothetical protein
MEKLNKKQQLADEIFNQVTSGYIFELESGNFEGEKLLENHEKLVNKIYELVVGDMYCGWFDFCQDTQAIRALARGNYLLRCINDYIRFCGKEFLMQRIEKYVKRLGY